MSKRAIAAARRDGASESLADLLAIAGAREAQFGNNGEAKSLVTEAMSLSPGTDARAAIAMTLAQVGDTAQAAGLVSQLNSEFPVDPKLQYYWLPTIRAAMALSRGNPQQAIAVLELTNPYELGLLGLLGMHNSNSMMPIYVRGLAYLKAGQGQRAEVEFKKMLGHRGLAANAPVEALAQLQVARAQAMSGDTASAQRSYSDFLALWKDADPDTPIYKQAKAEYAKLR